MPGSNPNYQYRGAELVIARRRLGLNLRNMASALTVRHQTLQRWESETDPFHTDVLGRAHTLITEQDARVTAILAQVPADSTRHELPIRADVRDTRVPTELMLQAAMFAQLHDPRITFPAGTDWRVAVRRLGHTLKSIGYVFGIQEQHTTRFAAGAPIPAGVWDDYRTEVTELDQQVAAIIADIPADASEWPAAIRRVHASDSDPGGVAAERRQQTVMLAQLRDPRIKPVYEVKPPS